MFRFTIRDVLWLMVVVGLSCAWWSARAEAERLQSADLKMDQLQLAIENEGYHINWRFNLGLRRPPTLIKIKRDTANTPSQSGSISD